MQELQVGFGAYLNGFYNSLIANTPALSGFISRGFTNCFAWAPARMVDAAEEMLEAWRRNDNGQPSSSAFLPVVIVAIAKDYEPVGGDFSRQLSDPQWITLPQDTKQRVFKVQQMQGERRAQLLFAAADESTARSLASQFCLWLAAVPNRRFPAQYQFCGISNNWPVMVVTPDDAAKSMPTDEKNLTMIVVDVAIRETIPFFMAPGPGEPNDGKGSGTADDPSGYPLVNEIVSKAAVGGSSDVTGAGTTWNAS
jgi:hypothetical protein